MENFNLKKLTRRNLLAYTRDSSSGDFSFGNFFEIIENVRALSKTNVQNNGIEFEIENLSSTSEIEIECNFTQITQVVLNLINNARDAISDLEEKWIKVQIKDDEGQIHLWVIDSGKGIPSDASQEIFRPFYTTKDVGVGTGLGLSISHGIIRAHQGMIEVDQTCANTCFKVSIPKFHSV